MLSLSLTEMVYSARSSNVAFFKVNLWTFPTDSMMTSSDGTSFLPSFVQVGLTLSWLTSQVKVTVSPSLQVASCSGVINSSGFSVGKLICRLHKKKDVSIGMT